MNWWPGNSEDSARQSSERNQRSARRAIRNLPVINSDSDEYEDANSSINILTGNLNLDGHADSDEETMDAAARELARQKALPVEEANYEDDSDAWKKEIKNKFDISDIKYWFNTVESAMKKYGINEQWSKKDAIVPLLPDEVVEAEWSSFNGAVGGNLNYLAYTSNHTFTRNA